MKCKVIVVLFCVVLLLTACNQNSADLLLEFETDLQCNDSSVDYVETYARNIPSDVNKGFLYSNVFSYGQYTFTFRNPDAERAFDEYRTVITIGNKFFNDEGVYLKTEIPEGYYLDQIEYKYGAMCRDETDEELIQSNLMSSFVYYSKIEYTESEFVEIYPELFE